MKKLATLLLISLYAVSCMEIIDVIDFPTPRPTSGMESLQVASDFDFSNTTEIEVQIIIDGVFVFPQKRVLYELFQTGSDTSLIAQNYIDVGDTENRVIKLPNHTEGLLLKTSFMGSIIYHAQEKHPFVSFQLSESDLTIPKDTLESARVLNGGCVPKYITISYDNWCRGNLLKIKSHKTIDEITVKLHDGSYFTMDDPEEYGGFYSSDKQWNWTHADENFPFVASTVRGIYVASGCASADDGTDYGAYLPNSCYEGVGTDADGDGIEDDTDVKPDDPSVAAYAYQPAKNVFYTLAFEDNWPAKGDYDFNDLVIGYNYRILVDASGHVSGFDYDIQVRAIGASFDNDFAIIFNDPDGSAVLSNADESRIDQELIESGAKTILRFNKIKQIYQGSGYVNVNYTGENIAVRSVTGTILLDGSVELADFDLEGFLMINQQEGREVHLPDMPPSSLADLALFGAEDDDSQPDNGRYYKTAYHLPWVLDIPADWEHPLENKDITRAYGRFKQYAEEDHSLVWYTATPENQNPDKVFKK